MVTAGDVHRRCLRTLLSGLLDEADFRTLLELVETTENSIAVEVDLTAVRCGDESVVAVEARDAAVQRHFVVLDIAAPRSRTTTP